MPSSVGTNPHAERHYSTSQRILLMKFTPKQFARRQAGFTLIEAMIVAAIAAMVILAAMLFKAHFDETDKAKSLTQGITSLRADLSSRFISVDKSFQNATTANVIAANIVPSNMLVSGSVVDPWGGKMAFTPVAVGGVYSQVSIATGNTIPQNDCKRTMEMLAKAHEQFIQIKTGSKTIKSSTVIPTSTLVNQACVVGNANQITVTIGQ